MAMDTMRMPEEVDMPLIVPQQSAAAPAGSMYFQDCNPLPSEVYHPFLPERAQSFRGS